MKDRIFVQETTLPYPLPKVFDFFSDARNLEAITPPSVNFHILTPLPIEMRKGAIIDYRLKLMGIPFKWRSLIDSWEPNRTFTDSQVRGPYLKWVHTHTFEQKGAEVVMTDRVEYRIPGWIFEPLIYRFFVGPQIESIFAHRTSAIKKLLSLTLNPVGIS